jgi:hypothetical protein
LSRSCSGMWSNSRAINSRLLIARSLDFIVSIWHRPEDHRRRLAYFRSLWSSYIRSPACNPLWYAAMRRRVRDLVQTEDTFADAEPAGPGRSP